MVGYGGLLTSIFRKFGVPLDVLHFPMSENTKIGAKYLTNLHLKLNLNGTLEASCKMGNMMFMWRMKVL